MAIFPNAEMQRLFDGRMTGRSMGAYFGDINAHERGIGIFEHFGVVPNRETPKICLRCNGRLRSMNDRARTLKWRYRCTNNHKVEPTNNIFLYNIRLRDIGADNLFQLKGMEVTSAATEVGVSADTAVALYGYFRDVAHRIAWHDYRAIGGVDDIVEVDESLVFKRKHNRGRIMQMT